MDREAVSSKGRSCIEAEPAKEEDRRADCDKRDIVDAVVHIRIAAPLAEREAEHERRDAGADMDDIAAGKVD